MVGTFCVITAAQILPIEHQAVASFHRQRLSHNLFSMDLLSHGIVLWPIAKQQGYGWLSLIGWSLCTELKGHIPGTQPEAEPGSSSHSPLHSLSPLPPLLCLYLFYQLFSLSLIPIFLLLFQFVPPPPPPALLPVPNCPYSLPPSPICCDIVSGIAKQSSSCPEVTIPQWPTSWSFISMVTIHPKTATLLCQGEIWRPTQAALTQRDNPHSSYITPFIFHWHDPLVMHLYWKANTI